MRDGPLVRAVPQIVNNVLRQFSIERRVHRQWLVERVRRAFDRGTTSFQEVHAEGCPAVCTCRVGVRFTKDSYAIVHRKG